MFSPKLCIDFTEFVVGLFRKVMFGSINNEFLSKLFDDSIHRVI